MDEANPGTSNFSNNEFNQKILNKHDVNVFLEQTRVLVDEIEQLKAAREKCKQEIENSCKKSRQEVQKMKQELINWIEQLASDMTAEITNTEERVAMFLESDVNAMGDICKRLQYVLESFETLGDIGDDTKFTLMRKEMPKIEEAKRFKDNISIEITPFDYEFRKSDQLVNLMTEITTFGAFGKRSPSGILERAPQLIKPSLDFKDIQSLVKQDITIGCGDVTSCVFMPGGEVVVCSFSYSTIKVFSPDFKLKSDKKIESVWDVAVVSKNQIIVTQIGLRLQFLEITDDTIEEGETIPVDMPCCAVDCKNDRLYVSCHNGDGKGGVVKVLTMSGDMESSFKIDKGNHFYLAANETGTRILISCSLNCVDLQCYDSNGTLIYKYSDRHLGGYSSVMFDSNDSIMLCCFASNNIHVVNSDGTQHKILPTSHGDINRPRCIGYRHSDKTLIVGQDCGTPNGLMVFKMKFIEK